MTIQPKIDRNDPYAALVQFTRVQQYLNDASIFAYFHALKSTFEELAYQHEERLLPIELKDRLQKIDLPHLFSRLRKDVFWSKKYEFGQFMAAIAQVAKCQIESIGDLGTYTVEAQDLQNPEKPLYRGWIYRSFVESSPALVQHVDEKGVIRLHDVSPLALWTLQRFQECHFLHVRTRECQIPETAAQELTEFFKKYDLNELAEAFSKWMVLSVNTGIKEETAPFDPQKPYRSLKRFVQGNCYLKDCRQSFMKAFSQFFIQAAIDEEHIPMKEKYQARFVTIDLPFLFTISPHPYVTDQERLIAAIQHVSKLQFSSLVLVQNDFGEGFDIRFIKPPKVELTTRAPIPLKMLITQSPTGDFNQQNISMDSNELIQLLFIATALNLPSLRKIASKGIAEGLKISADEMKQKLSEHFNRKEIQDVLKDEKILLVASKEMDDPDFHFRLFLLNLRIAPLTSLRDMLKITFPNQRVSKTFLKSLWDEVDDARKKELLNLFAHDVYSSQKPNLQLEQLQHFCGHLALGIVCFVHESALHLYRFLKRSEVRDTFIHPEVLQKILDTFPTVYPELMAHEEMDLWRATGAKTFEEFFSEFRRMNEQSPTANAMDLYDHLQRCFTTLNSAEEMEAGIARIFYKLHHFENQAEKMRRFASMMEKAIGLFQEHAPTNLKRAFEFLLHELKEYLELTNIQSHFTEWMKPFAIDDEEPVNRLMNIAWRSTRSSSHPAYLTLNKGWEKPIPSHLQVEWLYILTQLRDRIHLEPLAAAQFLAKHQAADEPTENPQLTLTLSQFKQIMMEKQLPQKALGIFIYFRVSEKHDDAALTEALNTDPMSDSEKGAFIQLLHHPDALKLMAPFPELEAYRQRIVNILEPSMLSNSLLSLSQFFTWKS